MVFAKAGSLQRQTSDSTTRGHASQAADQAVVPADGGATLMELRKVWHSGKQSLNIRRSGVFMEQSQHPACGAAHNGIRQVQLGDGGIDKRHGEIA
jgi:hypothetical protein